MTGHKEDQKKDKTKRQPSGLHGSCKQHTTPPYVGMQAPRKTTLAGGGLDIMMCILLVKKKRHRFFSRPLDLFPKGDKLCG